MLNMQISKKKIKQAFKLSTIMVHLVVMIAGHASSLMCLKWFKHYYYNFSSKTSSHMQMNNFIAASKCEARIANPESAHSNHH